MKLSSHLWHGLSGEHALVDNAWSSKKEEVAGNEVVVLRSVDRNQIADYQLVGRNRSPTSVAVYLINDNMLFLILTHLLIQIPMKITKRKIINFKPS
jgi:hypothetical protein